MQTQPDENYKRISVNQVHLTKLILFISPTDKRVEEAYNVLGYRAILIYNIFYTPKLLKKFN